MQNKRVIVIAPRMPEFDRECGSKRIWDFIEFLTEAGCKVTFAAKTLTDGERYIKILERRGVKTITAEQVQLHQLICQEHFDVAYFAFWHTAEEILPLIRRVSPMTRVIVDSIDVHFLRNSRAVFCNTTREGSHGLLDSSIGSDFVKEVNSYAQADTVLTVSEKEASWINDLIGDSSLTSAVPIADEIALSPTAFSERRGILFVGNFWHAPNVDAVKYLCEEILPLLDPVVLSEHPVYIVGNALTENICEYGRGLPNIKFVGWVPSVLPYLQKCRIAAVPLRYGAGTKGKIVQALMIGTPTVTTSIGAEGLDVINGDHALISESPDDFARNIELLLTDKRLWQRLRGLGRTLAIAAHGRDVVRDKFMQTLERSVAKEPKRLGIIRSDCPSIDEYDQLITRIRDTVKKIIPEQSKVIVISKGDEDLLNLGRVEAVHYPQSKNGEYAGHYPADSSEATKHLESIKSAKGTYFLIPQTSFWWLEHYSGLRQHLEAQHERVCEDANCIIYKLTTSETDSKSNGKVRDLTAESIEEMRPLALVNSNGNLKKEGLKQDVLVLGIYLADQLNNAEDTVAILASSKKYNIHQRWVSIGGEARTPNLKSVTVDTLYTKVPKFEILNRLIANETDLNAYEYILISDDDVILPKYFIDEYLTVQTDLDFVLAQPARTNDSYIDHPIVEQQWGVLARQTLFVEIGPVFSFHKSIYDMVLPFDMTSPMGWGYQNIWALKIQVRGLKMGIIDALPVAHNLRKPVANYSWHDANRARDTLLGEQRHLAYEDCFRVLDVTGF